MCRRRTAQNWVTPLVLCHGVFLDPEMCVFPSKWQIRLVFSTVNLEKCLFSRRCGCRKEGVALGRELTLFLCCEFDAEYQSQHPDVT